MVVRCIKPSATLTLVSMGLWWDEQLLRGETSSTTLLNSSHGLPPSTWALALSSLGMQPSWVLLVDRTGTDGLNSQGLSTDHGGLKPVSSIID